MNDLKALYFPHDANARNDERILFIRSKYGLAGYGLYWCFVETMHESTDGRLTCELLDGLAICYNADITLLKQFYNDAITCGLFVTDGVKYWSERVLLNKQFQNESSSQKSLAGKIGMAKRWKNSLKSKENNTVITPLYQSNNTDITEHNKEKKIKENKRKEIKENDNKENIIQMLFIRTFGRNPLIPEIGETELLIDKYGYERVENAFHISVIQDKRSLSYAKGILNNEQIKLEQAKPENLTTTQKMIIQMKAENGH